MLKPRHIERYKGFDIMRDIGKGYFIMLSIEHDSIRIIEDEYYDDKELAIKEIDKIIIELGENAITILKDRASVA